MIKTNRLLRSVLQRILFRGVASRPLKFNQARLFFPADKHFNLFFSRKADVEPAISKIFIKLVQPHSRVFDIGANIGFYTVLTSTLLGEQGAIVAVEPDPQNLAFLYMNIAYNKLDAVTVVAAAVSSREGASAFYQDLDTSRTSSIDKDVFHPAGLFGGRTISVATTTLDGLSNRYGTPDFIKCDIEGHEVALLQGGSETLAKRPVFIMEVKESNQREVFSTFAKAHYLLFDADHLLESDPVPLQNIQCENILAVPSDKEAMIRSLLIKQSPKKS